ncbi:MAG: DUF2118 domain-containing protein [Zestosphaera sp.]
MSEESFAYTPGLAASPMTLVTKVRALPIKGEILVKQGDRVGFDTIVGRCYLEGAPYIVKASEVLGVDPEEISKYMTVKVGDRVRRGDVIAKYSAFLGLMRREVAAPVDGVVESVNELTGHVVVREPPKLIEVSAYVRGIVKEVIPGEAAVVETPAAYIQGIIGFGGERHGVISVAVSRPDEVLDESKLNESHAGKIVVGGSFTTYEALAKAQRIGVKGVIVGGANIADVEKLVGYRIGVAITGRENIGFTLILTEGFGKLAMSERAFNILKQNEGREAAVNGTTQVRAGVVRPEVVIPLEREVRAGVEGAETLGEGRVKIGSTVRIIRYPYFGAIGTVVELPVELHTIETESPVRIVRIRLQDGSVVSVPRANIEIIGE